MGVKIYVGGLPYSTSESELNDLFTTHGTVESAKVITDKYTGQSRGFGFVEMSTSEEANAAIGALNGTQLGGRTLTVNEARPQEARTGGGGFGGGGGRGGGNFGGRGGGGGGGGGGGAKRDRW
ncbi:MAG: RNA-binding protein [Nitrospinae bacterium]|nr:RNA-binding protein [Nitrospinota bacterium]